MYGVFDYIFSCLKSSDKAIKSINHSMVILAWTMTTCAIVNDIRNYRQNKKIEKLEAEIKELSNVKGEQAM